MGDTFDHVGEVFDAMSGIVGSEGELNFVTYNTLLSDSGIAKTGPWRVDAIADEIAFLEADVVCLNEVFPT